LYEPQSDQRHVARTLERVAYLVCHSRSLLLGSG